MIKKRTIRIRLVLSFMIIKMLLDKKRLVENPTDRWQDLQSSTLSQRFSHPLLLKLKKLWHLISSIDIFLNAYFLSYFPPMSKRKSKQLLNQQHICRKELSLLRIAQGIGKADSPYVPFLKSKEMTCRDRGSPPVRVVAPCLAPIERRKIAALQLLSFPSLLLEEIDKEKVIPNPQFLSPLIHNRR